MTGSFLREPNDTLACLRMETLSGGTYLSSPTSSHDAVFHTAWRDGGWETFAENLAMQWRMYHWASRSHFHLWRKYFQRRKSSLGLLLSLQGMVIFMGILREIVLFAFLFARLLVVQLSSVFDHRQSYHFLPIFSFLGLCFNLSINVIYVREFQLIQ